MFSVAKTIVTCLMLLPMICAASGTKEECKPYFFGFVGMAKTTLSADSDVF